MKIQLVVKGFMVCTLLILLIGCVPPQATIIPPTSLNPTIAPTMTTMPSSVPTEVVLETPTLTPTIEPSSTVVPTDTPPSTVTPRSHYLQGEGVLLKEGVYVNLDEDFLTGGSIYCGVPEPGFAVRLYVENGTQNQFNLRFDASSFHAVDDVGNEYRLVHSGIRYCDNLLGIKEGIIGSNDTNWITLSFSGQIPLQATYILITADWISGAGPIVFRKEV